MFEACLICGKDLQYFNDSRELTCNICHKTFVSNATCIDNHYVCDSCHSKKALDDIIEMCLTSDSKNPMNLATQIMKDPFVHMHGPENHILIGAVLLTAFHNNGGDIKLEKSLSELKKRALNVPGGICGFWGCCGAAVSSGIFMSIISDSTPLKNESFAQSNQITSKCLQSIATIGGPRCCKRNGFLSIQEVIKFCKNNFNVEMENLNDYKCEFNQNNKQCIKRRCHYYAE